MPKKPPNSEVLTEEQLLQWDDYYRDLRHFPEFCERYLKIVDKDALLRPLILNYPQMRVYQEILQSWLNNELIKLIILKARQHGISTLIEAFAFWLTMFYDNREVAIITHEAKATAKIYGMFKRYYQKFPEQLQLPVLRLTNQQLEYADNGSRVNVFTSGSENSTSGGTYHLAHISELSKWIRDTAAMSSLIPACERAHVIIESTAYGVGNEYHERWLQAVSGKSEFKAIFIAWWENPEYAVAAKKGEPPMIYTAKERYYVDKFHLTENQMRWWRQMLYAFKGDLNQMQQEYPADPDEAFISTGSPYFDTEKLARLINYRRANPYPFKNGIVVRNEDNRSARFIEDSSIGDDGFPNGICLYESMDRYDVIKNNIIIAHDASEGIYTDTEGSTKKKGSDTDYNVTTVLNRLKNKQIAWTRNKLQMDQQAEMLLNLFLYFSGSYGMQQLPFIIIERNSAGLAVITTLITLMKQYGLPLNRLYHRTSVFGQDWDQNTESVGFKTLEDNKKMICGLLQTRIRESVDDDGVINDITTIPCIYGLEECMSFTNQGGKLKAQSGKWDDYVMSTCLSLEANRTMPQPMSLAKMTRDNDRSRQSWGSDERPRHSKIGLWRNVKSAKKNS